MKELLQTFGYTLAIGMVVFFAVMIISKSGVGLAEKWKVNSDRLEKEADNFVRKVDKGVDNTKDFLEKVQDNRDNPTKNTTPKPIDDKTQGESYDDVDYNNIVEVMADDPSVPEVENPLKEKPTEFVNTTPSPATNQKKVPAVSAEDDDKIYQIQLGVVTKKNTDLSNFRIVNGLGDIYAQTIDNSKSRILLGDFQGKRAARLVLEEVKQRGLKDAFLVEKKEIVAAIPPTKKAVENPMPVSNVEEVGNYVVRLGVFSEPPTEKLTKLSEIGKIYLQPHSTNPNLNIVSIGIFASKSQAEAALTYAKKQSFKDAFITTANSQLIDANAGKGLYYLPDEYKTPTNACEEQYVIQLSAAKRPNVGDFKTLLNMGNLFTEYDPANDVSKVFVGPFEDKAVANQALQKVKAKGFKQAFVVDRTKY